jgi:hypothetical protein
VFSAAVDGSVYAKHGTTIDTRLTVIDKLPADDPAVSRPRRHSRPTSPRCSAGSRTRFRRACRSPLPSRSRRRFGPAPQPCAAISLARRHAPSAAAPWHDPEGVELAYETVDWTPPKAPPVRRDL